jgi:hypothetical protein
MIRKLGRAAETIAIVMIVAFFAARVAAQSAAPASLEDQLQKQYKLAGTGQGARGAAGTVLVIQKPGLFGVPPNTITTCSSKYEKGSLHTSMLCLAMVKRIALTRDLTVGEKVYLSGIDVNNKNGTVTFHVFECDTCNGATPSSYKSDVVFQFSKGSLETQGVAQVTELVNQVFSIDNPDSSGANSEQAQNEPDQPQPAAAPSAAPTPTPAQASEHPIQVGQTLEEVQANTGGKLELITDLGDIKIYRYNGQRIKFENGKVTEIH